MKLRSPLIADIWTQKFCDATERKQGQKRIEIRKNVQNRGLNNTNIYSILFYCMHLPSSLQVKLASDDSASKAKILPCDST